MGDHPHQWMIRCVRFGGPVKKAQTPAAVTIIKEFAVDGCLLPIASHGHSIQGRMKVGLKGDCIAPGIVFLGRKDDHQHQYSHEAYHRGSYTSTAGINIANAPRAVSISSFCFPHKLLLTSFCT